MNELGFPWMSLTFHEMSLELVLKAAFAYLKWKLLKGNQHKLNCLSVQIHLRSREQFEAICKCSDF